MTPAPLTCAVAEESLGALVLGALDPVERDQVEAHVRDCPACSAVLAELAPLPGLLHRVDLAAHTAAPPPDLLERALEQVRAAEPPVPLSGRRRRLPLALALAAAAAAVVLVVSTVLSSGPGVVEVSATSPTTSVAARIVLTPTDTGTQLALTLTGVEAGQRCRLVVVARDGSREVAATWVANYEGEAVVTGTTAVTRADLARLEVTTPEGGTLVAVPVPA
ncbi:MAG: zf-HC2 domain-containing protein [Actinomycetales bacterium]|nr:zf-HC2 domain-containing protein [Actinomycetales bacterium]